LYNKPKQKRIVSLATPPEANRLPTALHSIAFMLVTYTFQSLKMTFAVFLALSEISNSFRFKKRRPLAALAAMALSSKSFEFHVADVGLI
jgi:hypothetical protein